MNQDKFWNKDLRSSKEKSTDQNLLELEAESTPDELLGEIVAQKTLQTQSELLAQIKNISPQSFERLVVRLLIFMGYGTEEFSLTTSYTNDGGIDGIVQADELGFDKIYIQAKKYENNVGRPDIQKFVGAMPGTNKGVFITTAKFAPSVKEYLRSRPENIVLIDGEKLTELMYKYNQGVAIKQIIELKSVDNDYFEDL